MTDSPQAGIEQHPSIMKLLSTSVCINQPFIEWRVKVVSLPLKLLINGVLERRASTIGLWSVRTKMLPIHRKVFRPVPASIQLMIEAVTSS